MQRHRIIAYLSLAPALFLTGCRTTLSVSTVTTSAPQGQVYYLPRVENLVTLERELTQCKVEPQLDALVRRWFQPELANLDLLLRTLEDAANDGVHAECDPDGMRARFGDAFPLIAELTKGGKPKDCKKIDKAALARAYQDASRRLVQVFFSDPVFVRGADWGPACPTTELNPAAVPATGLHAHLSKFSRCAPPDATKDVGEVTLTVVMRATATANSLPDVEHAYSIDYQKMSGGVKKTEYKITKYPNGTLKSVNSVIEDKTAEVISSTLRGVLQLAATSSGFPVTFPAAAAPAGANLIPVPPRRPLTFSEWLEANPRIAEPTPLCKPTILQSLRLRAALSSQLESAAEQIAGQETTAKKAAALAETKTAEAAKLQVLHDALPAGDPQKAELATKIKILKEEAAAATAAATLANMRKADLEKAQGETSAKLTVIRKKLTVTNTLLFRAESQAEIGLPGEVEARLAWFDAAALRNYCRLGGVQCDAQENPTRLMASVARYLAPKKPAFPAAAPTDGLVYREPVQGILLVCQEKPCLDGNGNVTALPQNTILSALADFPQLGVLASLPLTNRAFQNNSLVAGFSATGSLESLEYKSNARAEAAAKAFEGAAGDILTFAEAKKEAKKKDLETKKAEVDAETALLEAEKKRAEAKKALEQALNPPPQNPQP